jgi:hypothetical protein
MKGQAVLRLFAILGRVASAVPTLQRAAHPSLHTRQSIPTREIQYFDQPVQFQLLKMSDMQLTVPD